MKSSTKPRRRYCWMCDRLVEIAALRIGADGRATCCDRRTCERAMLAAVGKALAARRARST